MAELGWVEGRDYVFDARYGKGVAKASKSAREWVRGKPTMSRR
jgi:hypothetical protein